MFISPMLLETAPEPFSHADYVFEPKIDGHRLIMSRMNGGPVHLYTRHHNECTVQYPELAGILPEDIILDGEVAATDAKGAVDFEAIMERFSLRRADKIREGAAKHPVNYVVFDILRLDGKDLRALPLYRRREILEDVKLGNRHIGVIPSLAEAGELLFNEIVSQKMEGIVAKRANSIYVSNRSDAWLKIINWTHIDVYIAGYRKKDFGWLAAAPGRNGKLRPVGVIELGVTARQRMAFYEVKDQLITGEDENFVYLEPRLQAKIKTRNWTRAGQLRAPVFLEFVI